MRLATIITFAALSGITLGPQTAQSDIVEHFDFEVDGVLPSSHPEIEYDASNFTDETEVYSVSGGVLVQDVCPDIDNPSYNYPNLDFDADLSPARAVAMEVRVQITQILNQYGAYFQAFDGANRYLVVFSNSGVSVLNSADVLELVPLDLSQFRVYRVESSANSDVMRLYVDGVLEKTVQMPADTRMGFNWAGGCTSCSACSDANWDYVHFENVTPQVPALSAAGLVSLVGIVTLLGVCGRAFENKRSNSA